MAKFLISGTQTVERLVEADNPRDALRRFHNETDVEPEWCGSRMVIGRCIANSRFIMEGDKTQAWEEGGELLEAVSGLGEADDADTSEASLL